MRYRQYGSGGPMVSALGFGVMRLPPRRKGAWGSVNYSRSVKLLRAAMDAGVNLFDSHHFYHGGKSEVAIGRALKGWKGQKIYVQTKTPWYNEKPTKYFEKLLHEALEKLGVDSIDYFLHHSINLETWNKRGRQFIKFTDWALNRGLIRNRGFSSHDSPKNVRKLVDTGEFACCLLSYNWMNPEQRDTIAYAADNGMGVSIMNPVGGGALAASSKQILRLLPGARSAPDVALRYVLATPGVSCVLSGMTELKQLAGNLVTVNGRSYMTASQYKGMRRKLKEIHSVSARYCTGCGYCMPCEHGVSIPRVFMFLNRAKFFGQVAWAKQAYAGLKTAKNGDESGAACRRCGACEPKCPNKVPIMKQLQEAERTLATRRRQK